VADEPDLREAERLAHLRELREEYTLGGLAESDLDADPLAMLGRWVDDALAAELRDPTAMVLSTVSAEGRPSSRTVLLKGLDSGLVFFTNYSSRKGEDLAGQPWCALLFPWYSLQRQIRVEGRAERVSEEESAAYFSSRPRAAQLGAWASPQSRVVDGRAALDGRYAAMDERFAGDDVPLPPFWGGYRVMPESVELWQGRESRLHDRLRYTAVPTRDGWRVDRLAP
jgi:pyridoxamine 5'-phosphate oxidase